jgi:hypothetical protein
LTATEESVDFITMGALLWPPDKPSEQTKKKIEYLQGRIGRFVFQSYTCFFDLSHSQIYLCNTLNELKKVTRIHDHFVTTKLYSDHQGLAVMVETDIGTKKFLLDTGATGSILKESLVDKANAVEFHPGKWGFLSRRMVIGGKDFGSWKLTLFQFSDKLGDFDGVLGIDFLMEHPFILDFKNGNVLISRN